MPDPIIEPITIMVASIGPRARSKLDVLLSIFSFIFLKTSKVETSLIVLFVRIFRKISGPELLRLPSPDAPAARVQILPLPVCHRVRKSSPHEHRHLRYRTIELCPPAAFASRVRQIPSDRATKRLVGFLERGSHRPSNCDPRKLRGRHAKSPIQQLEHA